MAAWGFEKVYYPVNIKSVAMLRVPINNQHRIWTFEKLMQHNNENNVL
jgi:hypothetical protein